MASDLHRILKGDVVEAYEAAKTILDRGSAPLSRMLECVEHGTELHNRLACVYALQHCPRPSPALIAALLRVIRGEEPAKLRAQALEALGTLGGMGGYLFLPLKHRIAAVLQEALGAPDATIAFWACYAIGECRVREFKLVLSGLLEDDRICQGWWTVGEEASDALDKQEGREPPDRKPVDSRSGIPLE